MTRQIFVVYAHIVDGAGAFSIPTDYPKPFDSKHYGNDIERTENAAKADAHDLLSGMYKAGTRQVQYVEIKTADGFRVFEERIGALATLPDPEPTPEPAEE